MPPLRSDLFLKKQLLILLAAILLQPAAQLVIPLQQILPLRREHGSAAALSAGGGMEQLEAQLLLSGAQHRPRLGVGHVHGLGRRPQGMIFPDPVQQLRDPRPKYLVLLRIKADGHFKSHILIHICYCTSIPGKVNGWICVLFNKHTFC